MAHKAEILRQRRGIVIVRSHSSGPRPSLRTGIATGESEPVFGPIRFDLAAVTLHVAGPTTPKGSRTLRDLLAHVRRSGLPRGISQPQWLEPDPDEGLTRPNP